MNELQLSAREWGGQLNLTKGARLSRPSKDRRVAALGPVASLGLRTSPAEAVTFGMTTAALHPSQRSVFAKSTTKAISPALVSPTRVCCTVAFLLSMGGFQHQCMR